MATNNENITQVAAHSPLSISPFLLSYSSVASSSYLFFLSDASFLPSTATAILLSSFYLQTHTTLLFVSALSHPLPTVLTTAIVFIFFFLSGHHHLAAVLLSSCSSSSPSVTSSSFLLPFPFLFFSYYLFSLLPILILLFPSLTILLHLFILILPFFIFFILYLFIIKIMMGHKDWANPATHTNDLSK